MLDFSHRNQLLRRDEFRIGSSRARHLARHPSRKKRENQREKGEGGRGLLREQQRGDLPDGLVERSGVPRHDFGAGRAAVLVEDLVQYCLLLEAVDVVRSLGGDEQVLFFH